MRSKESPYFDIFYVVDNYETICETRESRAKYCRTDKSIRFNTVIKDNIVISFWARSYSIKLKFIHLN